MLMGRGFCSDSQVQSPVTSRSGEVKALPPRLLEVM
jgi:hypothetical protein